MATFITQALCLCLFTISTFHPHRSLGRQSPPEQERAVLNWIGQNAIPIKSVEAGNGFADLQPLKGILQEVRVVGLGEATHGTREFFQFKHRMLEFLAREMGFTGFALEASQTACQPINEYVLHGRGDLAAVLTGQGYSPWDTEEFAALIDWMHGYNKSVAEDKKVRFYGLDVPYNGLGGSKALVYLQRHAPEKAALADSVFRRMALADEKWPMWQDEFKDEAPVVLPQLQSLIRYLTDNKARLVAASSQGEFEETLQYTSLMEQMLQTINDYTLRAGFLGANLLGLMEAEPKAKFIVSAHNRHVNAVDHVGDANLGHALRAKLGKAYYAVGFEAGRGTLQTRPWLPEERVLAGFRVDALAPAPEGSLPRYLSEAGRGDIFLDLRAPMDDPAVERWWSTPQVMRDVPWVYQNDPSELFMKVNLKSYYDGLLFIEETSRARPTANALEKAARKVGF